MAQQTKSKFDVQITKADFSLQTKIGKGPLNPEVVKRCQAIIENNNVDFTPMATKFLNALKQATDNLASGESNAAKSMQDIRASVMELKANASIFHYGLVGNLANIMLQFLEDILKIDDNITQIINAHHTTLSLIIKKQMKGDGGKHGALLQKELTDACTRYVNANPDNIRKFPKN